MRYLPALLEFFSALLVWLAYWGLPVLVLIWLAVRMYRFAAPLWLVPKGKYERARAHYASLARSWLPGTRRFGQYGVAACELWLGNYEESLAVLEQVPYDKLDRSMKFAFDLCAGHALLCLEREPERARMYLQRAATRAPYPDILLGIAHAELSLGDDQAARLQYDAAMQAAAGPHKRFTGTIYRSREGTEQSTKLLAGWFLLRTGRSAEAIPLLQVAARGQPRSSVNDQAERRLAAIASGATTP